MLGKKIASRLRQLKLERLEERTLLVVPWVAPLLHLSSPDAEGLTRAPGQFADDPSAPGLAGAGHPHAIAQSPLVAAAEAEPANQPLFRLGVVGDSLSDEYAEGDYSYAKNWVETLATVVDVGAQGTWEAPRDTGFEYNWAQASATTTTLLAQGQHTGLAQQITAGLIDYAVLAIGQNDFGPWTPAYLGIYSGTWTQAQIDDYVTQVVSNIETALQTLDAAGGKVILANVVDYGVAPLTRTYLADSGKRELVTDVLRRVNSGLRGLAQKYQVPLVDGFQATKDLLGTNQQPAGTVLIGGAAFTNDKGVEPQHLFVQDAIHPHTVAQAAIANLITTAIQVGYGQDIGSLLFTEREMLGLVGRGGEYVADTLNLNYARYVFVPGRWQNPVEECNVDGDDNVAADDVLWIINYLNEHIGDPALPAAPTAPPPFYDVTNDGLVTAQDALTVIDRINNPPAATAEAEGPDVVGVSAGPASEEFGPLVTAFERGTSPTSASSALPVRSADVSLAAVDVILTQWGEASDDSSAMPETRRAGIASRVRDLFSGMDRAEDLDSLAVFSDSGFHFSPPNL